MLTSSFGVLPLEDEPGIKDSSFIILFYFILFFALQSFE